MLACFAHSRFSDTAAAPATKASEAPAAAEDEGDIPDLDDFDEDGALEAQVAFVRLEFRAPPSTACLMALNPAMARHHPISIAFQEAADDGVLRNASAEEQKVLRVQEPEDTIVRT